MALIRRDAHPDWGFFELPYPCAGGLFDDLPEDADGNARTSHMWSLADRYAQRLAARFPNPPEGAIWACDVMEREYFQGEWPDGDYESYAYVGVGILLAPGDEAARAFADHVRANLPNGWD